MTTLAEADRELKQWRDKVSRAGNNMVALNGHWVYMTLTGPPPTQLLGKTQTEVQPALDAMASLWPRFGMLTALLDECDELRAKVGGGLLSGITHSGVPDQIHAKLTTKSIQLPAREIPLAQRGLLDAEEQDDSISPADLLAAMVEAFTQANNAVHRIEVEWKRLYAITDPFERELERLAQLAKRADVQGQPDLVAAQDAMSRVKDRIDRNALDCVIDASTELAPFVDRARTAIEALSVSRAAVNKAIEAVRSLLDDFDEPLRIALRAQQGNALVEVEASIDLLQAKLKADKFTLDLDPEGLVRTVRTAREQLVALQAGRDGLAAALEEAKANELATMRTRLTEAQDSAERAQKKVRNAEGVFRPTSAAVARFEERLRNMEREAANGNWQEAVLQLPVWRQEAAGYIRVLEERADKNLEPIRQRDLLRNELDILRQEAGLEGVIEDRQLSALHQAAHDILHKEGCDLGDARNLIDQYQSRLSALAKNRRQAGDKV